MDTAPVRPEVAVAVAGLPRRSRPETSGSYNISAVISVLDDVRDGVEVLEHVPDLAWEEVHLSGVHPASPAWRSRPLTHTPVRSNTRLELLVPLADNTGAPFTDSDFTAFENFLVDLAGGFTRRPDVEGTWEAPDGRRLHDRSRSYVVSVSDAVADRTASLLDTEVRRRFRQEATFLEITPTRAVAF